MHSNFKAVSLSYKNTPLDAREALALNEISIKRLLEKVKEYTQCTDVLVLSTCNRTEVYYSSDVDISETLIKLIGIEKGLADLSSLQSFFVRINSHDEAVRHLFSVSVGLESQVVGDLQISNQVKHAYQWTADANLAGPFLHRLMHTIFFTNKKVVQETSFRDGAASVSYATVELIDTLCQGIENPSILVLGLGEIGADVCRNFENTDLKNITVINRTNEKAILIAEECKISSASFDDFELFIEKSDVIISSISNSEPIITKAMASRKDPFAYKYFIDLSVPRSIEASVEEVHGVLLYNIDSIQNKATAALNKRIESIPQVEAIIDQAIVDFNDWSREMTVSPTINKLKDALEQIRQEEISRFVKSMNEEESKKVDQVTKAIMQKIMKLPVLQLKAACKRGEAETLIDVLNDLFDLERKEASK